MTTARPSVAIFDYLVADPHTVTASKRQTAYGSIHFQLVDALCDEFDFTVFAIEFDNPRPDRIRHVPVRAVHRPLALLFITFHLGALWAYARERVRRRRRFDVVQSVESNFLLPTVCHAQFCHKAFLAKGWPIARPTGIRRPLRRIDYQLRRTVEPFVLRRAARVATSSTGLFDDIVEAYPWVRPKLEILRNAVDIESHRVPADFDRVGLRAEHGIGPDDVVLMFAALGDFELKGLPLVFDALQALGRRDVHLVCVGGPVHLVESYRRRAEEAGLSRTVHVLGMQPDVRPFLWAADAFVFPSAYESFSLATAHAAASGLPLIVTPFHLARDLVGDGRSGVLVERTVPGLVEAIGRFADLGPAERRAMGDAARAAVEGFSPERFLTGWRTLYQESAEGRSTGDIRT
jgi:glycosyltransferase involved in cell wall biosynthesis